MTSQRTRARLIERLREQGIRDEVVLAAMFEVPRHLFVDEALATRAYDDVSLPINFNQTISRPYIVARMIEVLRGTRDGADRPLGRVLEIGTGCGYQAAVLAQVAREVYTVERIRPLYERARKQLNDLKIRNVSVRYADGTAGLPEAAPFDGIIMAAAAPALSAALREQLAVGGRMVLPVGMQTQRLIFGGTRCAGVSRNAAGTGEIRTAIDGQGMTSNKIHVWLLTTALLAGCASSMQRPPVFERAEAQKSAAMAKNSPREKDWRPSSYTVQKGDTLYSIAFNYGFDYHDLAEMNGIKDPSLISVGQQIRLFPNRAGTASAAAPIVARPAEILVKDQPKVVKYPYSAAAMAQIDKVQEQTASCSNCGCQDSCGFICRGKRCRH